MLRISWGPRYESHGARAAEGGHPRSAGPGGRAITAQARLRRRAGARRASGRRGGRRRERGRSPREGRRDVQAAAREPVDRVLRDRGSVKPKVAVVQFPGSNDDHDAQWALKALGAEAQLVWHAETELPRGTGAVVLPGGFSYGDYLRCGAIARFAPIMDAVARFAAEGGLVLGTCNGFQILCEAGLLPGVLRPNASLSFICRDVAVRVERSDTPFTSRCEPGQRLVVPIKHGEGAWYAPAQLVEELDAHGQLLLRYEENPNGAVADVAGVLNETGNVMGLMPHPEHAVDPLLVSGDGALILASLLDAVRDRSLAAA